MKIFATSDVHGNRALIHLLLLEIVKREKVDALFIAGDVAPKNFDSSFTFSEIKLKQREGVKKICELLGKADVPVYMLIGNDDHISDEEWEMMLKRHNIFSLNMTSHPLQDLKIIGFQYVLPTPWNTNNELPENKLGAKLKEIEKHVDNKTILVTHAPPLGILDQLVAGPHAGSASIYQLVKNKQPIFHFFGHIHESFGCDRIGNTICCNVSCFSEDWMLRGYLVDTSSRTVREYIRQTSFDEMKSMIGASLTL